MPLDFIYSTFEIGNHILPNGLHKKKTENKMAFNPSSNRMTNIRNVPHYFLLVCFFIVFALTHIVAAIFPV